MVDGGFSPVVRLEWRSLWFVDLNWLVSIPMAVSRQISVAGAAVLLAVLAGSEATVAQVRGKHPDRGTYRPPLLEVVEVEPIGAGLETPPAPPLVRPVDHRSAEGDAPRSEIAALPTPPADQGDALRPAAWEPAAEVWYGGTGDLHALSGDGCGPCCDEGCDSMGCALGNDCGLYGHPWANAGLSWAPDRWFGGIELLLMFRKGDRLPPLVTSGPDTDPETAGELGQAGTELLFGGGDQVLRDLQAGGRFTLGTWVDPDCCRSLVLRGWFAGEESASFSANQDQFPVITRPFLNVSDGAPAAQDTQIVAFPGRATGSISVRATSDVFGADISARQPLYRRFGGTIDVLYGYQYMQLNEDLSIASTSISQDDAFAPLGSVLAIDDQFDLENEFHGGQFGFASRYREGCWSFQSLIKVGFGALDRRVRLAGQTLTSVDGTNAVDPNGLLVRQTNAGQTSDHTFGWVPELDFTLGWQQYANFDVTVGYNVIAMTDAIQVSGVIDPDLAVNLADPPLGDPRPRRTANYRTFYVQGIHFGLRYVY